MDNNFSFIIAIGVIFVLQLVFCFKVRNLLIRVLPTLFAIAATVYSLITVYTSIGWAVLGNVIVFMLSIIMLASCLLAWVVWIVLKIIKKIIG